MSLVYSDLATIKTQLFEGKITLPELVQHYLDRIKATENLNIYIEVFEEEALQKARTLQAKYTDNPTTLGRLFGAVISIKDVLCYEGHQVSGGSKILDGFESLYSATAVERCIAEDAIIIGRVNCDEFGMGSANENPHYGNTLNAANPDFVPGGSSGGSAVSVQADTCLFSLGSDTGGSVRQPASFCGIYGVKPTYGRVSRHGLLAYASSFDQVGILAKSIKDAALCMEVIAGTDAFDSTVSSQTVDIYSKELSYQKKAKIAYFDTAINHPKLSTEVRNASINIIEKYKKEGHEVNAVSFDYLDYIIPTYYVLTTAEASSNLSRYDGVRFGHRSTEIKKVEDIYSKSRTEGFGTEVKRRIILGTFVLSAGYYDAYYTKAQKIRRLIQEKTNKILAEHDFILMPVAQSTAWKIGEKSSDPIEAYLADIFTVQANLVGIPAVAFPVTQSAKNLPIGLQLMSKKFNEAALLAFVNTFH